MRGGKNKSRNQLWLARKRLGLGQKHVAYLLSHKTTDQVSRYEKGHRIPGLKMLLQLEIILGVPPRILYADYYEELHAEIKERAALLKTIGNARTLASAEAGLLSTFCSQEDLLRNPNISQAERDQIRRHVVTLVRRLSDL